MPTLTPQLLDSYPYRRYADAKSIARGREYYEENRVLNIRFLDNQSKAICKVNGDAAKYQVEIEVDGSGTLYFDCTCPYAEDRFCKHMIAAALAVSEYLKDEEERDDEDFGEDEIEFRPPAPQLTGNWQNKLDRTLSLIPRRPSSPGANAQRYAAMLLMVKGEFHYSDSYSFSPYIVKASRWRLLHEFNRGEPEAVNDLLDKDREWIKYGEDIYQQTNPAGCMNLSFEAITFLNFLQNYARTYYGGSSASATYFPLIAQFKIPVFIANKYQKTVKGRVHIISDPVDIQVSFAREQDNLVLRAGLQTETFTPADKKIEVVSNNPPWALMGNIVFPLRSSQSLPILSSFPIVIPAQHADTFREKYLRRVAELLPIKSDLIQWQGINVEPIPRLYLHDDQSNILRADVRFGYGEYELPATKSDEPFAVKTAPDSWTLTRVHRKLDRERYFYQLFVDPAYRLKRANARHPFGTLELRARAHPFDFLLHSVPLLTQAGFEIFGEEKLKLGKINRATPTVRVQITSGIDWFDLKAFIEYGDQQVSLQNVRKALKRGEHYIKLADGSVGQIPEDWLDKYRRLFNMAEETEDGFRVADFHLPLVDQLLEDSDSFQTPPDLPQRRERLRSFEQIAPQPLPSSFVGELRPYQKAGFDWLHFLREYKFGGILADDMGLGKTIQVLAFLQSLKEQAQAGAERSRSIRAGTLLVVPKSLLTNWQRESAKFTPDLNFLEHAGNFRRKDTERFKEYDVVLTTYGVMLRDIEWLRSCRFDYVILDESQAIKNPASQSAKAARLLNAEHRLVMTGTPVENNTFELWSQFAFLNPGLLGGMDYFKKEFAAPIESAGDEKTAKLLRQLVYPFILRRTKQQVAPELPPRTERVVYTDMAPAQKKLYAQTRERYRAELLGLIESEGMNDARFKILEGLLRLRQIAIHPRLVDKTYRGDAPKFDLLLDTLETLQAENHKALIFSQFVETLKLIRSELDARQIKYAYLDGQTNNRQDRVDSFQNDASTLFFLISLKAGGVGLNLTAADYVIHLDPWWNPAVEMQASDRAHRIGQDKPVFVYKIIARDTVEEKILQLQERKRHLVEQLITTEGSFFKSLTKDDVAGLFS